MIYIEANKLQDGLYQIQDGQIHKYKAKGGTVQTYEMGEIVRCKDCRYMVEECMTWTDKHPKLYCKELKQYVIGSFFCGNGGRGVKHE